MFNRAKVLRMTPAPTPSNEAERLAALYALNSIVLKPFRARALLDAFAALSGT